MGLLARLRSIMTPVEGEAWRDVGAEASFPPDSVRVVRVRGIPIAVFHIDARPVAIADVCPHMGASLSDGVLHDDGSIECPVHNLRFRLKDGKCLGNPMYSVRVFPARSHRGQVQVRV